MREGTSERPQATSHQSIEVATVVASGVELLSDRILVPYGKGVEIEQPLLRESSANGEGLLQRPLVHREKGDYQILYYILIVHSHPPIATLTRAVFALTGTMAGSA